MYYAHRRYRECKAAVKIRKKQSAEKLVQQLAAETIVRGLRRYLQPNMLLIFLFTFCANYVSIGD
jgi:hypothetical protein